jgi:hypothetical protein
MAIANAVGSWLKKGTRIGPSDVLSGSLDNPTIELRDTMMGVWPTANQALVSHGLRATGTPMQTASDHALGRAEPEFTLAGAITMRTWGLFWASLLQKTSFATGVYTTTEYDFAVLHDALTSGAGFLTVEAGMGLNSIWRSVGCVAHTLNVSVPTVDADGGLAEISADFFAANSTRGDAFTGSPAIDTGTLIRSQDLTWAIAQSDGGGTLAATGVAGFNGTFTKTLQKSPNIGALPDAFFLGELTGSGDISVILGLHATTSDFDLMMTAFEAVTPITISMFALSFQTPTAMLDIDVLLQTPTFAEQGNVIIATFPWELKRYDANAPKITATHATFAWVNQ